MCHGRDLSSNNLSGQLPTSLESLSSLTTLWVLSSIFKITCVFIFIVRLTYWLPDACRTISLLGHWMFFKIFPSKICTFSTIYTSYFTWFFLITWSMGHIYRNDFLKLWRDVVLSCSADFFLFLSIRNVENNNFSGPIPDKLLSIPKFKWEPNYLYFDIMFLPSGIYYLLINMKTCTRTMW